MKGRPTMLLKMLETRYNLRSRLWGTRMRKKMMKRMPTTRRKMISKCRTTSTEKCTPNKKRAKVRAKAKANHKRLTRRWGKLTRKKNRRT